MSSLESLYRIKDLQERYGVSRSTIYKWIDVGVFPQADQKIGGTPFWSEGSLIEFEQSRSRHRRRPAQSQSN